MKERSIQEIAVRILLLCHNQPKHRRNENKYYDILRDYDQQVHILYSPGHLERMNIQIRLTQSAAIRDTDDDIGLIAF